MPGQPDSLHPQPQGQTLAKTFAFYQNPTAYDNGVALRHGWRGLHSSKLDFESIEIEGLATGKEEVMHEWFQFAEWPSEVLVRGAPRAHSLLCGKQLQSDRAPDWRPELWSKQAVESCKQIQQRDHRLQEHGMRVIVHGEAKELCQQTGDENC